MSQLMSEFGGVIPPPPPPMEEGSQPFRRSSMLAAEPCLCSPFGGSAALSSSSLITTATTTATPPTTTTAGGGGATTPELRSSLCGKSTELQPSSICRRSAMDRSFNLVAADRQSKSPSPQVQPMSGEVEATPTNRRLSPLPPHLLDPPVGAITSLHQCISRGSPSDVGLSPLRGAPVTTLTPAQGLTPRAEPPLPNTTGGGALDLNAANCWQPAHQQLCTCATPEEAGLNRSAAAANLAPAPPRLSRSISTVISPPAAAPPSPRDYRVGLGQLQLPPGTLLPSNTGGGDDGRGEAAVSCSPSPTPLSTAAEFGSVQTMISPGRVRRQHAVLGTEFIAPAAAAAAVDSRVSSGIDLLDPDVDGTPSW